MQLSLWVLLVLAILYVPFYIWVRTSPKAEKMGLVKYGPAVMVKTQLGMKLINKYSKHTRFWNGFGTLSILLSALLMMAIVYILFVGILNLPKTLASGGMGIEYALAIPGINPLLPVGFGIVGMIVAICLHELAHGMQTGANGMRVKSTGLLHLVIPMGAFVEPNEDDVNKSSRRVKLDLYTAGISTNFIVGTIAFLIFAGGMLGGISSPYGDSAAVYSITGDSPAYNANIPGGSIFETVNGEDFEIYTDITMKYSWNPGDMVDIKYITETGTGTATIRWGLNIEKVVSDTPASSSGLQKGYMLLSVTESDGKEYLFYTTDQYLNYMKTTNSGDTVTLSYMDSEGMIHSASTVLGIKGSNGYLGISVTTSGMMLKTPNQILDVARNPFYGDSSVADYATSLIQYISGPFQGFDPIPDSVKWWYDVPGGEIFWWFVGLLYWIFWVNIILGVSNAIPAIPFDGGFVFMGILDWLLEKAGRKDREKREELAGKITSYVSSFMIIIFILVILAAII